MKKNLIVFGCLCFLLVFSCKKKDQTPPVVSFVSPAAYSGNTICRNVSIEVNVEPGEKRTITKVEFLVDGVLIQTDESAPYACTWTATDHFGELRTITARAYDDEEETSDASVAVKVWNGIEKASMPGSRYSYTADAVNGKIYVIGGYETSNLVVQEFDPLTNSWSTKASPATGHAAHVSCVINNKIYVFGGDKGFSLITDVDVYDPANDSWTTAASIPAVDSIGFSMSSCAVLNGKAYVFGGKSEFFGYTKVGEYDPATDTWTKKANKVIFNAGAVNLNNELFLLGGCPLQGIGLCSSPESMVESYDPVSDNFTYKTSMLRGRSSFAASVSNGAIYVFGGVTSNSGSSASIEKYNSLSNTFSELVPMPMGMTSFATVALNGKIYIIGSKIYEYTPE